MASTDYKESTDVEAAKLPLMVSVTAPSTLEAGYTFEAYVNDDQMRPFTCEVVRVVSIVVGCWYYVIHSTDHSGFEYFFSSRTSNLTQQNMLF